MNLRLILSDSITDLLGKACDAGFVFAIAWSKSRQAVPTASLEQSCVDLDPAMVEIDETQELGSGGFGRVFAGLLKLRDEPTPIAVKLPNVKSEAERADVLRSIQSEGAKQAALSHPNIVRVFGTVPHRNSVGLVMERMQQSLNALLSDPRSLTDADKVDIMLDVYAAMLFLHSRRRQIIHQDLKPDNVLVAFDDARGRIVAKVTDFGFAVEKQSQRALMTRNGANGGGTERYQAPELFRSVLPGEKQMFGTAVDVFAFGATVFEIFSNRRIGQLFEDRQISNNNTKPRVGWRQCVRPHIAHLIEECTHPIPESRATFFNLHERMSDRSFWINGTSVSSRAKEIGITSNLANVPWLELSHVDVCNLLSVVFCDTLIQALLQDPLLSLPQSSEQQGTSRKAGVVLFLDYEWLESFRGRSKDFDSDARSEIDHFVHFVETRRAKLCGCKIPDGWTASAIPPLWRAICTGGLPTRQNNLSGYGRLDHSTALVGSHGGVTAAHVAALVGNRAALEQIANFDPSFLTTASHRVSSQGFTVMHFAVASGTTKSINTLTEWATSGKFGVTMSSLRTPSTGTKLTPAVILESSVGILFAGVDIFFAGVDFVFDIGFTNIGELQNVRERVLAARLGGDGMPNVCQDVRLHASQAPLSNLRLHFL